MHRNNWLARFAVAPISTGLGLAAFLACGTGSDRECRVGADCASGACSPDGLCMGGDLQPDGSAGEADAAGHDAEAGVQTDAGVDGGPLKGCVPNKDGIITREENPIAAGLRANYRVAQNESVSTAGTPDLDGKRIWDFSTALASDTTVIVETQPLDGKWYAADYPSATYVAKLSQNEDALGVFEATPAALLLLGVVSSADGLTKTILEHDPKVSTLTYPLKLDAAWTTSANVTGYYKGILYSFTNYTEKYESSVDAAGTLKTPLGSFEVLRVNTLLTRSINFFPTKIRTMSFVTECYGTIATVVSKDNDSTVEFTNAAEIRRIAP